MSVTTIRSCDLCEERLDADWLRVVPHSNSGRHASIDICGPCQDKPISIIGERFREEEALRAERAAARQAAPDIAIEDMELSVRTFNCLKREGIHTAGELASRTVTDLMEIRNLGNGSVYEVNKKLAELGLTLRDEGAA